MPILRHMHYVVCMVEQNVLALQIMCAKGVFRYSVAVARQLLAVGIGHHR